jgi:hypothetical protein|tara:strand:+ start:31 stop:504 length:474 start_codon:yes stop_codon:yes gene_type:complete
MNLFEFVLPQKDCENITNFVYKEKTKWKKDLNNVKSFTSGFCPDYDFLHDLGDICCNNILPTLTNHSKWQKSCWWINLYEKGHYTNPHRHTPETYSMIVIIKPALEKYCLNFHTEFSTYKVEESQGLCLIFDSRLSHSVDPVQSERITIAMDFVKNQ